MPAWLLALLESLGPQLLSWAVALLEKQYPGLAAIIQSVIAIIEGSTNPAATTAALAAHVAAFKADSSVVGNPPSVKQS